MKPAAWLGVAAVGAAVTIGAQLTGHWTLHAAFKPATTIAIWVWARSREGDVPARRHWVEVGLALSLAGDVALMWPQGFIAGLVAFLLAHLAYIVAFTRGGVGFARHKLPFVAYGAIAAAVLSVLWPHIDAGSKVPVLVYVVCLACMAAQALAWWLSARSAHDRAATPAASPAPASFAARAAIGGVVFMVSDASLAINKFMQPIPASPLVVLSTYWIAQALIAGSLVAVRRPRDRSRGSLQVG